MPKNIPTAEQSAASIVDTIHSIAGAHEWMGALIGKIIAPPPEIQIAWNDIILTKEQVYIDLFLLRGYYRETKGHIVSGTQEADCGCGGMHAHPIDNDYTETWITTDTLQPGDLVSVLPIKGGQQFIVLGRVVWLGETSSDPHGGG